MKFSSVMPLLLGCLISLIEVQQSFAFVHTTHSLTCTKTHGDASSRGNRCTSSTQLRISNMFQSTSPSQPQLPKDVKDAVSSCRAAVQKGLEDRLSRMDVEFPVGTKFGVEKGSSSKKRGGKGRLDSAMTDDDGAKGITTDVLDTSDRELARLFVEMFQPVGGDNIACVFSDDYLADMARNKWKGDVGAECKIMSVSRGKRKKALAKGLGSKGMGGGGKKSKKKEGICCKDE